MAERPRGLSVRWKLTLSYAAFFVMSGVMLLAVAWLVLRQVPERVDSADGFVPGRGDLAEYFAPIAWGSLVILAVVGVGGGWLLAGWMLRPLHQIHAATALAAGGSLSHRIRMAGSRDEFRDLADAFDGMLDRVERQVEEQRRFAANASHELRTPLAATRAMLEVAAASPELDVPTLLERLERVNDRASASVEALLLLSRVDGVPLERAPTDLSLAAEEALESLVSLATSRGASVAADLEPVVVLGDPDLLARVAANLLHNALSHGSGGVRISTRSVAGAGELRVDNDGAVLDPTVVPTLVEPFRRADRAARDRAGERSGVGLGLAIVASIVRAHGGTLAVNARPEGGLSVVVRIPAP